MYLYLKALHIIFITTWFAGMFYIVRLFIYNREANDQPLPEKTILQRQYSIMIKRLWLGITWPSAIITLLLGPWLLFLGHWNRQLFDASGKWLLIKLLFVLFLYGYHWSLHLLYRQQSKGVFRFSSQQLRIWNEVATIFLVAIVMLATVKQSISAIWAMVALAGLIFVLMSAINIYKNIRGKAHRAK